MTSAIWWVTRWRRAEKSFGAAMADDLRFVASDVTSGIVPGSGHWIMEENPQVTVKLVVEFLGK
jgi:pimeloyl-ACP methyl ester carboxylesterase